jgi:hypothetical protein
VSAAARPLAFRQRIRSADRTSHSERLRRATHDRAWTSSGGISRETTSAPANACASRPEHAPSQPGARSRRSISTSR